MQTVILVFIFIISTFGLVKGADWFLESAEKIGLAIGLSHFIIGVTIVSFGTSFPELFTGVVAVLEGAPTMVAANAIGSNIANILLGVGLSALVGGKLVVTKSLIDLDLPLLAGGTAILLVTIFSFTTEEVVFINRSESLILVFGYFVYFIYTLAYEEEDDSESVETLPSRKERRGHGEKTERPKLLFSDFALLVLGVMLLTFSSRYLVQSVIGLSELHQIAIGAISIIAVAVGTTLPELIVSVKAVINGDSEIALGNVFGSNIFNSFIVIGIPGLIGGLPLDHETYYIGIPFLILATVLFIFSGISRRIHAYEGAFYILLYILFIIKIFGIF